jgi:hypothetical protein
MRDCVRFPPFIRPLKDFLSRTEHFVQRFLKVRGALRELLSHLCNILFEALLDLLAEELLQSPVAKAFGMLRGMVGDNVGDKSAREPLRPLVRVLREKGIERPPGAAIARRRRL